MKLTTPMELEHLLNRIKHEHLGLSFSEKILLQTLTTFVNGKLENGYESWPSTDTLIEYTGMSKSSIERGRKVLITNGWVQVESGKSKGNSNHYFINADKIKELAALSGTKPASVPTASTKEVVVREQHVRNTSGLVQNKQGVQSGNSDGSPSYFVGVRTHSWAEYRKAEEVKRIADINEQEMEPF